VSRRTGYSYRCDREGLADAAQGAVHLVAGCRDLKAIEVIAFLNGLETCYLPDRAGMMRLVPDVFLMVSISRARPASISQREFSRLR
jgi:hypothetical protein